MDSSADITRLFLVTPPRVDPDTFPALLAEALAGGDVAAVLIGLEGQADGLAASLAPIVQSSGAAAVVAEDTRLAGRAKADGVHIATGLGNLRDAIASFRPAKIVGAGNLNSRHDAMEAGEVGPDYLFFGRPHGDTHEEPHPKALELAAWWSEVANIPAVVMAGRSLASVEAAAAAGASFVALHDAVWSHVGGPGEAMRLASDLVAKTKRRAA